MLHFPTIPQRAGVASHPHPPTRLLTVCPPSIAQGMNTCLSAKCRFGVKHFEFNFIHKAIRLNPVPSHFTDRETKTQ